MQYINICDMCRHLHEWDPDDPNAPDAPPNPPTCDAFPQGIPKQIWIAGADHRVEISGLDDGGIRFEPDGPVSVDEIEEVMSMPARMRARREAAALKE